MRSRCSIKVVTLVHLFSSVFGYDFSLTDYDCRHVKNGALDYNTWRETLQQYKDGWSDGSTPHLVHPEIDNHRFAALKECPLAVFFADAVHALACFSADMTDGCYYPRAAALQKHFSDFPIRILVGTDWPIISVLNSILWKQGDEDLSYFNCEDDDFFSPFLQVFENAIDQDTGRPLANDKWFDKGLRFALGDLERNWVDTANNCPLGFLVANIIKLTFCAWTESICFRNHAHYLTHHFSDPDYLVHFLGGTKWPIFPTLEYAANRVKRHGFKLDFTERELLLSGPLTYDEESISTAYKAVMSAIWSFQNLNVQIPFTIIKKKFTIVTMVHGPEFAPYIEKFVTRAFAVGVQSMMVFALDEFALRTCRHIMTDNFHGRLGCVPGTPNIMNKFLLPLVLLNLEIDTLWVDFDMFFMQDPTKYVLSHAYSSTIEKFSCQQDNQEVCQAQENDFDLLVGGSFAVECACSGIMFYRATDTTKNWLKALVQWMYEHPYEHDQKLVSSFLFAGERVAFRYEVPVTDRGDEGKIPVPKWDYLEGGTRFVAAKHTADGGWTGHIDDIVLFHFLHGRSDTSDRDFTPGEDWLPLMDVFYNHSIDELFTNGDVKAWEVSVILNNALMISRVPERPPDPLPQCNGTLPMQY